VLRLCFVIISVFALNGILAEQTSFEGGTALSGNTSPYYQSVFLRYRASHSLLTPFKMDSIIETRNGPGWQERKNPFYSIELKDFFYFSAGNRFVPGPTLFPVQKNGYSGFHDLPHARGRPTLWFAPYLIAPGIFYLEGNNRAGVFWSFAQQKFIILHHPENRTTVLSANFKNPSGITIRSDIRLNKTDKEGFFLSAFQTGELKVSFEAERNPLKDNERLKGRSILAAAKLEYKDTSLEAAGEDQKNIAMRFVSLRHNLLFKFEAFHTGPVFRVRDYSKRNYDTTDLQSYHAGAGGWMVTKDNFFLELLIEGRYHMEPLIETGAGFQSENLSTSFHIAGRRKVNEGFLFYYTMPEFGSGATFFPYDLASLTWKMRSKYLYLFLTHSIRERYSETYLNIQGRWIW